MLTAARLDLTALGRLTRRARRTSVHRAVGGVELSRLARRIRRDLTAGEPVAVAGDFQRVKAIYEELVVDSGPDLRRSLCHLVVPLVEGAPDLAGMPARRAQRRIGRSAAATFPLEHLLLVADFARSEALLALLFPEGDGLPGGGHLRCHDEKGFLSIGQHRDVRRVLSVLAAHGRSAGLDFVVERWADHSTFHPPVRIPEQGARARIDVAQLEGRGSFGDALERAVRVALEPDSPVALDSEAVRYDESCVWSFNRAFWRTLGIWERVTGKTYQRALPKGKSESHHREFVEEAARRFADHVRELERAGALAPKEELWFHEKAPGSGEFTAGLLDVLQERHPGIYERMRVVLSDVSAEVLALARCELERRGHLPGRPGGPEVLFRDLSRSSEPYLERADGTRVRLEGLFLYYRHANFFDQLPTRLFEKSGKSLSEILVQAVVDARELVEIEARHGLVLADLLAVIDGSIDLAEEPAAVQERMIRFWSEVWLAVRLAERTAPVARLPEHHPCGSELESVFADVDDVRFVTSDAAMAILLEDIRLLHPVYGYACFTDIFLQRSGEFRERWIELAKYDNGVWVGTNGSLLTHRLEREGWEHTYHPVELTLGEPTPVHTLTVRKREATPFVLRSEVVQALTSIDARSAPEVSVLGLSRDARNDLADLPGALRRVAPERDWMRRMVSGGLDLGGLLRELYYHEPAVELGPESAFVKVAAVVAEVLDRHRDERIRFEVDISNEDLRDLDNFLRHRPLGTLATDLVEIGAREGDVRHVRLRLPTLLRSLEERRFPLLAEVDLPRSQSVEQQRRRILQLQAHVDFVSVTSGRMADPRFLRSGDLLRSRLLDSLPPDRLVVTLEMRGRHAADLDRDLRGFEAAGVRNLFLLTGDYERGARWWLDSVHGLRIADRLRNGEGADGRPLAEPPRVVLAGALTWGGIPDLESRIDRDVALKAEAGADLLFTQPVYDLRAADAVLDLVARRGLDRRMWIVPEIFPIATLEQLRSLERAPGIAVPAEMAAAFRRVDRNVAELCTRSESMHGEEAFARFERSAFAGVPEIPGYPAFFGPARARETHAAVSLATDRARARAPKGGEVEMALHAAREAAVETLGFAIADRAMRALRARSEVSGFLFVARTGRELGRLAARARDLRAEVAP